MMPQLGEDMGVRVGIDPRHGVLVRASDAHPEISFCCSDSLPLPFRDASFDVALQFVTFSSILDGTRKKAIAREIVRVLKSGGTFLWYDFRYPNPLNPFTTFEPRRNIRRYFPDFDLHLASMTVLPPLARPLHDRAGILLRLLERLPFLRSHYFGWFVKASR
jgi:ubiquinone/menaquinone biosynthesis C-methylase UbiE